MLIVSIILTVYFSVLDCWSNKRNLEMSPWALQNCEKHLALYSNESKGQVVNQENNWQIH